MFIYKTTNNVNGKQYIGLCTRDDDKYLGSGVALKQAIKKYGKENFSREIIEQCDDFEYLLEREQYWISFYNAVEDDMFYNISYGGYAGQGKILKEYWSSFSDEERKTVRNWKPHFVGLDQSGDKHISKTDPNWTKKVSKAVKNTWDSYTEEEREARVKKMLNSGFGTHDRSGKKNSMYGRSAVKEQNLKWYTNGVDTIYVSEGTQPADYKPGRTFNRKNK